MHNYMVEFKVGVDGISEFITLNDFKSEEDAVKLFMEHKPSHWVYVGIKEVWFEEEKTK